MMNEDMRSNKFVLIPFCLMSQAFQAEGIVRHGWRGVIKPIMQELIDQDINIIQMPCPESLYGGYEQGLKRKPKGIKDYNNEEFRSHCNKIAVETINMIKAMRINGYEVIAILGIEYSPSCSVKIQYTNKGTIQQPGIFVEELKRMLKMENIEIPFVSINRRGIKSSVSRVKNIFQNDKQSKLEIE